MDKKKEKQQLRRYGIYKVWPDGRTLALVKPPTYTTVYYDAGKAKDALRAGKIVFVYARTWNKAHGK